MEADKHEDSTKEEGELSDDDEVVPFTLPSNDCETTSSRPGLGGRTLTNCRNSQANCATSDVSRAHARNTASRARSRRPQRTRYRANGDPKRLDSRPSEQKKIPSLLSLNFVLPPNILQEPPPSPPPPLPSVPPPDQPEPPPLHLPPETCKPRKRKAAPVKKNAFCIKSPPAGDIEDPNYIDLLLEYQQLRKQLADISHSELLQSADKENNSQSEQAGKNQNEALQQDSVASRLDPEMVDHPTEHQETDTSTNNLSDSEDLDTLRLRLDALKTAKRRKVPAPEKKEAPKTLPFAPCSLDSIRSRRHAAKRRSVEFLNRRSRQSSHRIKKQRSIDSGWRQHKERDRSHREGERRYYEKRHEQYDMNHRRIEVQKILTLNDPEEQYRKFMELVAGVKEDQMISNGLSKDNYEPVEMDLDSDKEQGAEISSLPVNDGELYTTQSYPMLNLEFPPFHTAYPVPELPEGLALTGCFADVDYRPLFDGNLLPVPRLVNGYLPDVLSADASNVYNKAVDQMDIAAIPDDVGSKYGTEPVKPVLFGHEQLSDPVDGVVSETTANEHACDEMADDGENEEAVLRAKLLQSLKAKKKQMTMISSKEASGQSEAGLSQEQKMAEVSETGHPLQNRSSVCSSAVEETRKQELTDKPEQTGKIQEKTEQKSLEEHHQRAKETKVSSLKEQTKLDKAQVVFRQVDTLPDSGSNSPVYRLGMVNNYKQSSQHLDTDDSGAGSPYLNQDSLDAFTDAEVSDASLRWRTDHIFKYSHAKYHKSYYKVPQHKPVVICLGDDSESDDDEQSLQHDQEPPSSSAQPLVTETRQDEGVTPAMSLPGNLDVFLREARMSVEGKGKSLAAYDVSKKLTEQDRDTTEKTGAEDDRGCEDISSNNGIRNDKKKLLLVEAELAKHRCLLREKQAFLDRIKKQIARKKSVLSLAEEHVKKLREQLVESEKIVKTNRLHLLKFNEQAQDAQSLVDEKRARVQALEAQLDRLGRKLHGDTYKPSVTSLTDRNLKVTISKNSQVSRHVILPETAESVHSISPSGRTVTVNSNEKTCVNNVATKNSMPVSAKQPGAQQKERKMNAEQQSTAPHVTVNKNIETGSVLQKNTVAGPSVVKSARTGRPVLRNTKAGLSTLKGLKAGSSYLKASEAGVNGDPAILKDVKAGQSTTDSTKSVTSTILQKDQQQARITNMTELAKEKERLTLLAAQYAEMIRRHKDAQAKKISGSVPAKKFKLETSKHLVRGSSSAKGSKLSGVKSQVVSHEKKNLMTKEEHRHDDNDAETCQDKKSRVDKMTASTVSENTHATGDKDNCQFSNIKEWVQNDGITSNLPADVSSDASQLLVSMPPYKNRFSALCLHMARLCQISSDVLSDCTAPVSNCDSSTSGAAYQSCLLQFRSYRLCPYIYLKSHHNLTSLTHSHKLNIDKVLCQYDLMGTCSDDKCQYQHRVDYELSSDELLKELASYCPSLYCSQNDTHLDNELDLFVSNFKNSNNKLTVEEQGRLLVNQVSEALKKGGEESVITLQRHWRPSLNARTQIGDLNSDVHLGSMSPNRSGTAISSDLTWTEPEVRYWCNNAIGEHEEALLADSSDTDTWISMAYHKLNNNKKRETGLNDALSVLAKGLESNRSLSALWLHYLELYEQKCDTSAIDKLYRQAIKYSPCFEIYWKYIQRTKSFSDSIILCQNVLNHLTSADLNEMSEESNKKRSHHVLQIFVYMVMLCVSACRFSLAMDKLKDALTSAKDDYKWSHFLSIEDKVLLHLLYSYMNITEMFPYWIYSPSGLPKHWLVNKELLLTNIPWYDILNEPKLGVQHEKVQSALASISQATKLITECKDSTKLNDMKITLTHLHRNWTEINCLLFSDLSELLTALRSAEYSALLDAGEWYSIIIETLCRAYQQQHYSLTTEQIGMLCDEALKISSLPARLCCAIAEWRFVMGDSDAALVLMEDFVISLFACDVNKPNESDPNLLYMKCLGLPLPLSYASPPYKSHATKDWLEDQLPYMWQCYCLLLELQGFVEETTEAYEAAILSIRDRASLTQIWIRYLNQQIRVVNQCEKSGQAEAYSQFTSLVYRCLNSLPSRVEVPYMSGQTWSDYEPHNAIVSLYLDACHRQEQHLLNVYEKLIRTLPHNVPLIVRAIDYMKSQGHHSLATGYCMTGLDDQPYSRQLWIIYISLLKNEIKVGKMNPEQLSTAYRRATFYLPMEALLWKDWALYEWQTSGHRRVQYVFGQCTLAKGELERLTSIRAKNIHSPSEEN